MIIEKLKKPRYLSTFAYIEAQNLLMKKPVKVAKYRRDYLFEKRDMFIAHPRPLEGQIEQIFEAITPETQEQIRKETKEILGPFWVYPENNFKFLYDPAFKFCPECIKKGRHYIFHQLKFVDRCPIHGVPLRKTCPHCGAENTQQIVEPLMRKAFTCAKCKKTLLDSILPEELIMSYTYDAEVAFPFANHNEEGAYIGAYIFTTKENEYYRMNQNMIPIKKYTVPDSFLMKYFETGELPPPDITIEKGIKFVAESVDDIIHDAVSEIVHRVYDEQIDTAHRFDDPNRNVHYHAIAEILMHNTEQLHCTKNSRKSIVSLVLKKIIEENSDALALEILNSKGHKNIMDIAQKIRTAQHHQIILFEQADSYDLYMFPLI